MKHTVLALTQLCLFAAGCGASANEPAGIDAQLINCEETPTVIVGRCYLSGSTDDCAGSPDEQREFLPIVQSDVLGMVSGPQGSLMFVLAIQTFGIDPGDPWNPADPANPTVDLSLQRDGSELARYRGRPAFLSDAQDSSKLVAAGLFVVLDETSGLSGSIIDAVATVVDNSATYRCGRGRFSVQ